MVRTIAALRGSGEGNSGTGTVDLKGNRLTYPPSFSLSRGARCYPVSWYKLRRWR